MTDRQDRLAKALRENLRRRKEQARGRAADGGRAPDVRPDAGEGDEARPIDRGVALEPGTEAR